MTWSTSKSLCWSEQFQENFPPPFVCSFSWITYYYLRNVQAKKRSKRGFRASIQVHIRWASRLEIPQLVWSFCCQLTFWIWLEMRTHSHWSLDPSCLILWILSITSLLLCPCSLHCKTSGWSCWCLLLVPLPQADVEPLEHPLHRQQILLPEWDFHRKKVGFSVSLWNVAEGWWGY